MPRLTPSPTLDRPAWVDEFGTGRGSDLAGVALTRVTANQRPGRQSPVLIRVGMRLDNASAVVWRRHEKMDSARGLQKTLAFRQPQE